MSIGAKPMFDPAVCPKCFGAPCRAFGASGGFGRRVLAVPAQSVPPRCPLLIPRESTDRYTSGLDPETARQICAAAGGSSHTGTFHGSTPARMAAGLARAGKVFLLAAPRFGGGSGAVGGGGGTPRKPVKEEKEEEDGEVAKDEPKPSLFDPAWIGSGEGEESPVAACALGAPIRCKVNTGHLSLGDSVVITAFLKGRNGAADAKLDTLSARVGEGREDEAAVAKWIVPETGDGRDLEPSKDKIYFIAKRNAERLSAQSPLLALERMSGECAEVSDALFFHNSALMSLLPSDGDAFASLGVLADAIAYGSEHANKVAILYGHADTTGDAAYNVAISRRRAEAVKALLDGDGDAWVAIALEKGSHESLRNLLAACAMAFGWECDPGAVSGLGDPALGPALKAFQAGFNFEFEGSLTEDGKLGRQTWGALYQIQREQLGLVLEARGLDGSARLKYAANGALVACGEKYPLEAAEKDGFESQRNRRVEIAFVEKARRQPKTRGQVLLGPITVVAREVKQGSLTEIVLSCGHGKDPKDRQAKRDQDLEIVADAAKGDLVHFEAIGTGADEARWRIHEYGAPPTIGRKFDMHIRGFEAEKGSPWFPNLSPKTILVEAEHVSGITVNKNIRVFPSYQFSLKVSKRLFEDSESKGVSDYITKWLKKVLSIGAATVKWKLLNGSVTVQTGFKEDKKSAKVFWGYSLDFAFTPLIGLTATIKYPTPVNAIPQVIKDHTGDVAIYAEIGGAIEGSIKIDKVSPSSIDYKLSAKGKAEISAGAYLVINHAFKKNAADKPLEIIRVDAKGKGGVSLNLESSKNSTSDDPKVAYYPAFDGLKLEASFLVWDGWVTKKGELVLLDKASADPRDIRLAPMIESMGRQYWVPGPV